MTTAATAIVLAAGEGTRMRSDLPKVAHEILGVPLIRYVVTTATEAGVSRVVVVTGHKAEEVESLVSGVTFARQDVQHGTGHAVMCALDALGDLTGPVVVLAGDTPLIRAETIRELVVAQERTGAACVLLSAMYADPAGYGRVIRDEFGRVMAIVEHKDLAPDQSGLRECNTGTYCFDGAELSAHLHRLENDNAQGEYYLTDMVGVFVAEGLGVEVVTADDPLETLGINSRVQLAEAAKVLQRRINEQHMLAGVTMTDPGTVWIAPSVRIGRDVTLGPFTLLMGDTGIGDGCAIGPEARIADSTLGRECVVDSSIVEDAVLGDEVRVGPRAVLRTGTSMGDRSTAETCVEIAASRIGGGAVIAPFSRLRNAEIGRDARVAAGTITCEGDGPRSATVAGDVPAIGRGPADVPEDQ